MVFGLHLMLDFYECDHKNLADYDICYKALDELPKILGMHKLMPPYVFNVDGNEEKGGQDPGGYSGFVVIAESHISLHTFVKRGFVTIDVYSCKQFNSVTATKYFENIFKPKFKEVNIVNRGLRYPEKNIH